MADHTINIDVYDLTVPELNPINIAIINLPNPVKGYSANAEEVKDLIQIPRYTVFESGTSNVINGRNYFDYFPEEGGGGGSATSYSSLTEKPAIDNHTLISGNNTSSDLGLQTELTLSQLEAVNSGITSTDVAQIETNKNDISSEQAKTKGMTEGGSNHITVGGIPVYVSSTAPTGDIPDGSVGVGW